MNPLLASLFLSTQSKRTLQLHVSTAPICEKVYKFLGGKKLQMALKLKPTKDW